MKKRNFLGEILFYGIILVVIVVVISTLSLGGKQDPVIYSDVMSYLVIISKFLCLKCGK